MILLLSIVLPPLDIPKYVCCLHFLLHISFLRVIWLLSLYVCCVRCSLFGNNVNTSPQCLCASKLHFLLQSWSTVIQHGLLVGFFHNAVGYSVRQRFIKKTGPFVVSSYIYFDKDELQENSQKSTGGIGRCEMFL